MIFVYIKYFIFICENLSDGIISVYQYIYEMKNLNKTLIIKLLKFRTLKKKKHNM